MFLAHEKQKSNAIYSRMLCYLSIFNQYTGWLIDSFLFESRSTIVLNALMKQTNKILLLEKKTFRINLDINNMLIKFSIIRRLKWLTFWIENDILFPKRIQEMLPKIVTSFLNRTIQSTCFVSLAFSFKNVLLCHEKIQRCIIEFWNRNLSDQWWIIYFFRYSLAVLCMMILSIFFWWLFFGWLRDLNTKDIFFVIFLIIVSYCHFGIWFFFHDY